MPTEQANPNSRRDEIVEIASRLFYQQGFGATGIKQIIDAVGIAKGTFYSHFESKEELGLAWLKARHIAWKGWLQETLGHEDTAIGKLLGAFDFLEQWLEEANYRGCAFINTMAETPNFEHPMRAEVAAHKKDLHETFKELAAEHFQESGKSNSDSDQAGTTIFLLFEGALVEAQNFHEPWPIHAAKNEVQRILNPPLAVKS